MRTYVLSRFGYSSVSLLLLSLTIFLVVRATGDPALLLVGPGGTQADFAQARTLWGLDRPLPEQYVTFLTNAFRGDFGTSFQYRVPVRDLYFERLPNSLLLAFVALLISLGIGIPLGIVSAVKLDTHWDTASKVTALLGLSVPNFFIG